MTAETVTARTNNDINDTVRKKLFNYFSSEKY
ncbi:MAG: hypothetical protein ACTS8R_08815 [Arsenophonus sp. NC-QC1-MAG3]